MLDIKAKNICVDLFSCMNNFIKVTGMERHNLCQRYK